MNETKQLELFEKEEPIVDENFPMCRKCGVRNSKYDFREMSGRGALTWCVECTQQYNTLKNKASKGRKAPDDNKCACCGEISEFKLLLDHDHETGVFRGWICRSCNSGIGNLGDDIPGLEQAIKYLEKTYGRQD